MFSFLIKATVSLTCLMITGVVSFAFYKSVKESFDYDIEWNTVLRDSSSGNVSHVDMAPVDIQGNKIVFKDANNNRVYYSGDFISSKVEARIKSDSGVGRLLMSTLGTNQCQWFVQDKKSRINEVIENQEGIAKAFLRVQSLIQSKEDLGQRLVDLNGSIKTATESTPELVAQKAELEAKLKDVGHQIDSLQVAIKKTQKELASSE